MTAKVSPNADGANSDQGGLAEEEDFEQRLEISILCASYCHCKTA